MIAVAAAIAVAVAVGVAAERRWREGAERAARGVLGAILYVLLPPIVFFNIARLHVDADVGGGIALAYAMLALTGLAAWFAAARVLRLSRAQTGTVLAATMQVNTGYVGLPLVVVLLGSEHLGEAAAYDALVTAPWLFGVVFAVGAAFGTRAGEGWRQRTRAFFTRNPPLLAVIAAIVAPDALAPDLLVDASRIAVLALVPLGFFAVGVTLAAEADEGVPVFPPPLGRAVALVLALRLAVAPALLYLMALALIDLPGSYLLLAAMPCGVNTLVVAHAYGLDMRIAAGAVAWSTAIVVAIALVADTVG
ncbi:MAG TPA: AEC family transporter [Solirubrobacteraceae bacterium]|nr:AEC family transporter [Solirubrobacteraceae bacterium]